MKKVLVYTGVLLSLNLHSQQWQPVPLVTQAIKDAGHFGGEGCQWPQAIEVDGTDGSFLLFGTDVGGIYRSTNGGEMWEPCNVGYNPRGNCGFSIDPNNNQRALAIGGNSTENWSHGIYLTTDQAATWEHVYEEDGYDGYRGFKDKVAYDKSSFNAGSGYSMIAYWSNPAGGLFKSTDGGGSWEQISNNYGDCIIAVDPGNGTLYIGNDEGLFRSTNGGEEIIQTFTGEIRDVSTAINDSAKVWITTADKLYLSVNSGESFTRIEATNYPSNVVALKVSPSNTNKLVVCNNSGAYNKPIYYSGDGGISWKVANMDNTNAFMPFNGRTHEFAWHPTDENKIWAFGGDWITSSENSGATFAWDANGYTGILVGGKFNFNVFNPDILYVGSQDYNGAVSFDNGVTWKYCNASGNGWGGFTYGAYAASKDVLITQASEGWHADGKITISRDGGKSFAKTDFICSGIDAGLGDPKDSSVIYFCNWISRDMGETWTEMEGCEGALIANLYGDKEVYGVNGADVVKSTDLGLSWEKVVTMPAGVKDIAVDHVRERLYITVSGNRLYYFENNELTEITGYLPKDQYNNITVSAVAVDPVDPVIVYAAAPRNIYATDASVMRSRDAGFSWEIMTRNPRTNNTGFGTDGAREAFALRVNPKTRELWAAGGCYGIWKIAKPDSVPYSLPVIRLNKNQKILKTDETFQLVVKASYEVDTDAQWSSTDISIATVDTNGLVTARSPGMVTITAKIIETGDELFCTVVVQGTKAPFGGVAQHVPGIIEAEDYDQGGEGIAYHDATLENSGNQYRPAEGVDVEVCSEGGFNVGWTEAGEWLLYSVEIDSTAQYDIEARIASASNGGALSIDFGEGNVSTGEFSFDATGGWQSWKSIIKKGVQLYQGNQDMKINMLASGFNLNYIKITPYVPVEKADLAGPTGFSIYPNPLISGKLHVELLRKTNIVTFKIFSVTGSLWYEKDLTPGEDLSIDRAMFETGMYIFCMYENNRVEIKKLLVQ